MAENSKIKLFNAIYIKIYLRNVIPKKPYNEFLKENRYFLNEFSEEEKMKEYSYFLFFEVCKVLRFKFTKLDIKEFIDSK